MRLGGLSDPLNPLARAMGSALRPQRKEGAPAVATDNGWCCNSASKVESYDDEDVKARLMESGVSPPQSPGADSAGGDDDGEKMQWKTWKGSARILGEGEEEGDTLTAAAAVTAGPAAAASTAAGGGGDTPSHEEGGTAAAAAAALEEDEGRSSAEPAQQDSTTAASSTAEDFTLPSSALLQRSNAMIEQRERESPPSVRSSRSARSARSHGSRRSMPGPIRGSHGSLPSSARSGASTTSIAAASTKTKAKKSKSKLGKGATTTAKPKTKTKMKSKTKSPSAAPAQPSPDPKLLELATAGAEILPPYGVLRVTLDTEDDVTKLVEALDDGYKLIVDDLKAAATALGEKTCGLLFQALVVQGVAQRVAGNQPSNTPILPPSPEKKDSNMHVGREDNVAGKGKINLKKVPGGRKASALLAARAMNVVQLLRIKLEDDGDLAQAKKTLANCRTFFSKLGDVGKELGFASLHETVQQLNAI